MATEGQQILESIKALTEAIAMGFGKKDEGAAAAAAAEETKKKAEGKTVLRLKYMKINDYSGRMEDWDDWWFGFKKACKTQSKKTYDELVKLEKSKTHSNKFERGQIDHPGFRKTDDPQSLLASGLRASFRAWI